MLLQTFLVRIRAEPILLFFHLFFFPAILFSNLLCSIFSSLSTYFCTHKRFFLLLSPAFEHAWLLYWSNSQHGDCSIRVSRSFSCFSRSIILCWFKPVCDYLHLCRLSYTVLSHPFFQIFTYFSRILLFAFCFLFFKKKNYLLAKLAQP